jgi:hypothetical protein
MSRNDKRFFLSVASCTFALAIAMSALAEKGGHGGGQAKGNSAAHGNSGKHGNSGDKGNAGNSGNHGAKSNAGNANAGGGNANAPAHSNAGGGKAKKFAANDRGEIETYYREQYSRSGNCPPGLAKKDNGCMPPGQARRWNAGSTLPADVVIVPVPSDLRVRLAPPIVGYEYGYVDGGVVLYAPETRLVVDFVAVF